MNTENEAVGSNKMLEWDSEMLQVFRCNQTIYKEKGSFTIWPWFKFHPPTTGAINQDLYRRMGNRKHANRYHCCYITRGNCRKRVALHCAECLSPHCWDEFKAPCESSFSSGGQLNGKTTNEKTLQIAVCFWMNPPWQSKCALTHGKSTRLAFYGATDWQRGSGDGQWAFKGDEEQGMVLQISYFTLECTFLPRLR